MSKRFVESLDKAVELRYHTLLYHALFLVGSHSSQFLKGYFHYLCRIAK